MRVGVSLRSAYSVGDARTGARWMIERAAAARAARLDSLFVGDHHVIGAPFYQNTPMLGRLLAEWGDAPAGALYSLPLWNPVLLAEHIGTLASIADGRFIVQCGLGDGRRQFAAMAADIRQRVSTFERALATIRTLLAGGEVGGARVAPVPSEPVKVWIGGSADPAIDRAARLGDGFLAAPYLSLDQARAQIDLYRERCAAQGRPVGVTAIRRDVHIGADAADAERPEARRPLVRSADPPGRQAGSRGTRQSRSGSGGRRTRPSGRRSPPGRPRRVRSDGVADLPGQRLVVGLR